MTDSTQATATVVAARRRGPGRPWKPGESGNPAGRPPVRRDLDALADRHGPEVIGELVRLALHAKTEGVRRAACSDLADRFYGRPAMAILAAVADVAPPDAEALRAELLRRVAALAGAADVQGFDLPGVFRTV